MQKPMAEIRYVTDDMREHDNPDGAAYHARALEIESLLDAYFGNAITVSRSEFIGFLSEEAARLSEILGFDYMPDDVRVVSAKSALPAATPAYTPPPPVAPPMPPAPPMPRAETPKAQQPAPVTAAVAPWGGFPAPKTPDGDAALGGMSEEELLQAMKL